MPDFERVIDDVAIRSAKTMADPVKSAFYEGYYMGCKAGKRRARLQVVWIALFVAVITVLVNIVTVEAGEYQYDEQALWGETNLQLDEDEPDQDPVYDEDDPVYDESDDYLDEDYEDE